MKYKLIALDIDDTLLNNERKVTPKNADAIHRATEAGVHVVLASGRLFIGLKPLYNELGLKSACICSGGSQIVDASGKEIFACPIDPKDTSEIMALAHELGAYYQVYIDDHFCYENRTEYTEFYHGHCGFSGRQVPNLR